MEGKFTFKVIFTKYFMQTVENTFGITELNDWWFQICNVVVVLTDKDFCGSWSELSHFFRVIFVKNIHSSTTSS